MTKRKYIIAILLTLATVFLVSYGIYTYKALLWELSAYG